MRRWFLKYGAQIASNLRANRPVPIGHWYLDEMVIVIGGKCYWLWRAVDNDGKVLDFLVQSQRSTNSVKKLMKSLLKKQRTSLSLIVTNKLRSYHAAFREIGLSAEYIDNKRANNRAENSHRPVRRRIRKMQRFKSPGSVQRFLNIHAETYNHFNNQRRLINRLQFKKLRTDVLAAWNAATMAS